MKLPSNLRDELKIPLGKLILEENVSKDAIIKELQPNSYLITVGDATTEKMINYGIIPSLQIIDGQEKRVKRGLPSEETVNTLLTCDNPAGEISTESIETIKQGFKSKPPVRITVNGEEDLLVIPVCMFAPENSVIMYGQPNEGLVIVKLDEEIRNKTRELFELME